MSQLPSSSSQISKKGRPPSVSDEQIVLLIQKYMQYFLTNTLPSSSAQVWTDMSKDLMGKWKPHSVYTHVRDNKKGHLDTARKNLNINLKFEKSVTNMIDYEPSIDELSVDPASDESYHDNEDENVDPESEEFGLVLSQAEWDQIKPDEASDCQTRLKPRVWANVISKAFWNQYRLPCAFLGRYSYIRKGCFDDNANDIGDSVEFYLKFVGYCKHNECDNKIVGVAHEPPLDGKLTLIVETRDTRKSYHAPAKRPLNGPERKNTGRELKRKLPVGHRQKLLAENMHFGENEPAWIQKSNVYRQAKMEYGQQELGIKNYEKTDMITNIRSMLSNRLYDSAIREIGAKTFYVFYCTPEQVFIEKEYCRVMKGSSKISLDATGSVVKKFEKQPGRKTGHIFLYTVTINFEGKTLPVYQMLSERHDASFITFWLNDWIRRCSATIPNEAVSDMGRALLLAMAEAFNRMSLKEYIDVVFKWATQGHKEPKPVNTYIRVDVAHIMAAAARWECIKALRHPAIKNFYLRTIALMIDCQTVPEFEYIFRLTCVVALHQNVNDSVILRGKKISVLEARKLLEDLMSEREDTINKLETSTGSVEFEEEVQKTLNVIDENNKHSSLTHEWIKTLIEGSSPQNQQSNRCNDVNGFYFAEFLSPLERFGKEFPILTAACLPGIQDHASSAYQERYFAEMRQKIFEGISLPCTPVRFLNEHIVDFQSGCNEIAAKLKHCNHRKTQSPYEVPTENEYEAVSKRPAHTTLRSLDTKSVPISEETASAPCSILTAIGDKSSALHLLGSDGESLTQNPRSTLESSAIKNSDLKSPLFNKAANVDDSDFISDEMWRGLCNDDSFIKKFIELEEQEECKQLENTDLADAFNLSGDITGNFHRDASSIGPKIFDTSVSLDTSLHDHDYLKSAVPEGTASELHNGKKSSETTRDRSKPKKKGFYFEPDLHIRFLNENYEVGGKKGFLLRNGSKLGIMKMDKIAVDLQQTCGFDAIVHVLQFGAIYNPKYHHDIKSSNNSALQFINKFIEKGPNVQILQERIRLLNRFYPLSKDPEAPSIAPYKLNVEDSITTIWKFLFCSEEPTEPSATQFPECNNPSCVRSIPKDIAYIAVNTRKINHTGIGGLQEAVSFVGHYYNVTCRQKNCKGTVTETIRPNFHVFIDLDTRTKSNANKKFQCQLADVPLSLELAKNDYRLIGVIEHIPQHFIAYCRKPTGKWIKCDDMETSFSGCHETKNVTPIGAIYIAI